MTEPAERYEISFESTPELSPLAMRCLLWNRGKWWGPLAALVLVSFTLAMLWVEEWRGVALLLSGALVLLALLLLVAVMRRRAEVAAFFRNAPHKRIDITLEHRGVTVRSALGEAQLDWRAIDRVWHCPRVVLLIQHGWQYVAVPKPAMPPGALEYALHRTAEVKNAVRPE